MKAGGPGEVVPPAQTGTLPLAGRDGEGESEPQGRTLTASIRELHAKWWEARIARQQEIDAAIARAADVELLYDRPYEDKGKVRVVPVRQL